MTFGSVSMLSPYNSPRYGRFIVEHRDRLIYTVDSGIITLKAPRRDIPIEIISYDGLELIINVKLDAFELFAGLYRLEKLSPATVDDLFFGIIPNAGNDPDQIIFYPQN